MRSRAPVYYTDPPGAGTLPAERDPRPGSSGPDRGEPMGKTRFPVRTAIKDKVRGACERRCNLRISAPFQTLVRGTAPDGRRHEFRTRIENLSTGGIFFSASEPIQDWRRLTVVMRLSKNDDPACPAPMVIARGEILRMEPLREGGTGYAVRLKGRRFI
jgi:hypothetical protein